MREQENWNHDVKWGTRTLSAATAGGSLTANQIKQWITECLGHRYDDCRIKTALLYWTQRGSIRANVDGTYSWLGVAAELYY